ncbi:MAG: endoglucanase [Lachnospiraceae bacterium]|nr:endoglucanase [Lachnospiraceae bacterium]
MQTIPYEYKNLPIPGGGYVTGFLYGKTEDERKPVLYARTDIGGTYRFDAEKETWINLISHVTQEDLNETFPLALAVDDLHPGRLYIACGIDKDKNKVPSTEGVLAISEDYGETFTYEKIPVWVHGNANGRGTGDRLWVEGETIYFASMRDGLLKSNDRGKTFQECKALPEKYLTFVTKQGDALIVGSAGVTRANRETFLMRGHSLYVSYDGGVSFEELHEPPHRLIDGSPFSGVVAQRYSIDEEYLYVTFAATGRRAYVFDLGYSCDGGDTMDGHIVRYTLEKGENGRIRKIGKMVDITPGTHSPVTGTRQENIKHGQILEYGFSGICASRNTPGFLVASTIVKDDGDSVFVSRDYGETWNQVLYDLVDGEISFRAPYMRPECNGGHSLIHWLSDIKMNPVNDDEAWFNSGTGVFRTKNLTAETVQFTDWCDGIEETVHLNIYGLPGDKARVLDILGDLGGFVFQDLDTPCDNSFADDDGNRYITCINADYSDSNPDLFVVTARGNWKGQTKGGLILTKDQGKHFDRLPMPFGLSEDLDEALSLIECPNVNAGWVAMSGDGKNIVWSVAEQIDLPVNRVIVSRDGGETFDLCRVYDSYGKIKTSGNLKVFADRVIPTLFYAFGSHSDFYVSRDGGRVFKEIELPLEFPEVDFGLIDCANKTEVRCENGKGGIIYIAIGEEGLWKLHYEITSGRVRLDRLTKPGTKVYRMGLGILRENGDYLKEDKAIYFSGIVDGAYGFYRSLDDCKTFERLNTSQQMYGEINSMDGDKKEFGTFYIATGSNGAKYGRQL